MAYRSTLVMVHEIDVEDSDEPTNQLSVLSFGSEPIDGPVPLE